MGGTRERKVERDTADEDEEREDEVVNSQPLPWAMRELR